MKYRSTSRANMGFTDQDILGFLAFLTVLAILFTATVGIRDFHDRKNFYDRKSCQTLAESVKDLSRTRKDGFVIDTLKLHAFSKTEQPISFWLKRIIEESSLVEIEDYIVIENGGDKQHLLTIEATLGIAASAIESKGGFFQNPETRNARRVLECLQKSYFPKVTENAQ